jgi:hypothetical protein
MMYAARNSMYDAGKIALGLWLLFSGCTDAPARPAPQPAPAPDRGSSEPGPAPELRSEHAALRLGLGPSRHRLITDAAPPAKPAPPAEPPGFVGKPERATLEQLRSDAVTGVKKVSEGRGLAFELTLASGARSYYEPEQHASSANWYAEVAAYYLDRALGLGRVPPVIARKLAWSQLEAAAADDPRRKNVVVDGDGQVRGALIQRPNGELVPAATPAGWENWLRAEPAHPGDQHAHGLHASVQTPEPSSSDLPAELSDMIVFDFLTLDTGHFGKLLTLGPGGPLVLLDNATAFSPGPPRRSVLDARLLPLTKFRRRTIDALRALDLETLRATLAADPLGPFLNADMLRGIDIRRGAVLEHVAKQERRYGAAVYAW